MRIISGTKKHYNIAFPPNVKLRPTTDFCKEAVFNIVDLYFDFEKMRVLDLFAGTGAISFEFASRGTKEIKCIDSNFNCISSIKSQCTKLKFNNIVAIKQDAIKFLQLTNEKYDLIFADPPYNYQYYPVIHETVFGRNLLHPKGWLILEHSRENDFSEFPNFIECRKYGETYISIFYKKELTDK